MNNDVSFSVRPLSNNLEIEAGETATGEITIINPDYATGTLNYKISVAPYSVAGEGYKADLVSTNEYTAITDWIILSETTGSLEPGEKRTIEYTINVPENAPSGGQYSAILVDSLPTETDEQSTITNIFEITHIIYANIAGETVHEAAILSNDIPTFVTKTPVTARTTLSNYGNTHEYANINLVVKNALNGETIYSEEETDVTEIIMPNTTRLFEREITNLPSLGVIEVTQSVLYNDETSTTTSLVYICPLWFALLVAATIIVIIAAIIKVIRNRPKQEYE